MALSETLAPALARGQSPHHAMVASPESFAVCERTVYNYVNGGVLPSKRHSLPMAVRYRKRRGTPVAHKVDRHCTEGQGDVQSVPRKAKPAHPRGPAMPVFPCKSAQDAGEAASCQHGSSQMRKAMPHFDKVALI